MKADDIKQKIEQFTDDIYANDANCIVIVNPKDGGHLYGWLNGDRTILADMMFHGFRMIAKEVNVPPVDLFRLAADVVEDGENYGC